MTTRGWFTLVSGVCLVFAGWLFGRVEAVLGGLTLVVMVCLAVAWTLTRRPAVRAVRRLHPSRLHVGAPAEVELEVSNEKGKTPVMLLVDRLPGDLEVRALLYPMKPGATVTARYPLRELRRGIVTIGPARIEVADPFGLAARTRPVAEPIDVTVFPQIHRVSPPPRGAGDDPHAGSEPPHARGTGGDDFYTLRSYVPGDDLRRVHWPYTARFDQLMVRQNHLPWQGRVTIVVDNRSATSTEESFENIVSAAASLLEACAARGDLVRLVMADGSDSGHGSGSTHAQTLMEHLAVAEQAEEASLLGVARLVMSGSAGGTVVFLLGDSPEHELRELAKMSGRHSLTLVLTYSPSRRGLAVRRRGFHLVGAAPGDDLPSVWESLCGPAGGRSRVLAGFGRPADER
ncbi:MAG: membrane protein [Acidimicrobiales bacterium]|nr:MAG: membrane protein [Acidimicrobiales bacterium]